MSQSHFFSSEFRRPSFKTWSQNQCGFNCFFFHYRIQPLHLFILCFTTGLTSLVRGGPYWFQIMETMADCKTYWWGNVLLIINLLTSSQPVVLLIVSGCLLEMYFYVYWPTVFLHICFLSLSSASLGHGTYLLTSSVMPPLHCCSISTNCMSTLLSYHFPKNISNLQCCKTRKSYPSYLVCIRNRGVFTAVAGGLMLMTIASGAIMTALLQLPVFLPSSV